MHPALPFDALPAGDGLRADPSVDLRAEPWAGLRPDRRADPRSAPATPVAPRRPLLLPAIGMPGLSFRQWLLAALLLITLLLGGAAVQALVTLDHVARQSRDAARSAMGLTENAQRLAERTVAMERSARQFLVLDDASLRERYQAAAQEARATLEALASALDHQPPEPFADWRAQADAASAILQAPGRQRQAALQRLTPLFNRLHRLNDTLGQLCRRAVDQRNDGLLVDLEHQRQLIGGLVIGAIVLAALLAIGFGHWLSRPMARIEAAIERLGANQFDQPVDVRGPADLRRLGRQLDWLRQRLATLESDKTRFVRHISHELKTPLASIREGVALLQDGVAGSLSPDQAEITRILGDSTAALQAQIEDLLRYHALASEAQQLQRQPVDLRQLLQRVCDAQRLQWQARGLRVVLDGDCAPTPADADKLAMALGNLLSNALRFSPVGGEVRFLLSRQPGRSCIACIDQGPGVAAEDADRIFAPFYQGRHQPPGARHGSGIGLSIVHEVVQAHGGTVRLMPPASTAAQPAEAGAAAVAGTGAGAHFRIDLPDEHAA